jgi:hypothetical protein
MKMQRIVSFFPTALTTASLIFPMLSVAQVDSFARAAEPEHVTRANYKQAFHYSNAFLQPFLYDTAVTPNWIGKTDSFWYSYRTSKGTGYWRVDPDKGSKVPLFDNARLATLLSEMTQKPLEAAQLPLSRVSLDSEGVRLKFVVDEVHYEYELQLQKLSRLGKASPQAAPPPAEGRGGLRRRFQEQDREDSRQRQRQGLQQRDQQQRQSQQQRGQDAFRASIDEPLARGRRVFSPDRKAYVFVRQHLPGTDEPAPAAILLDLDPAGSQRQGGLCPAGRSLGARPAHPARHDSRAIRGDPCLSS